MKISLKSNLDVTPVYTLLFKVHDYHAEKHKYKPLFAHLLRMYNGHIQTTNVPCNYSLSPPIEISWFSKTLKYTPNTEEINCQIITCYTI